MRKTLVWDYFEKVPDSDQIAKCFVCQHTYSFKSGISNLAKHLERLHKETYNQLERARYGSGALNGTKPEDIELLFVNEKNGEDCEYLEEICEELSDSSDSSHYSTYEIEVTSEDGTKQRKRLVEQKPKRETKRRKIRHKTQTQEVELHKETKAASPAPLALPAPAPALVPAPAPAPAPAPPLLKANSENIDDEYEMFGRLIASKLRKMKNPNTRDYLMNDVHNLVYRTCVEDRIVESGVANVNKKNLDTTSSPKNPENSQQNSVLQLIIKGDPLSM